MSVVIDIATVNGMTATRRRVPSITEGLDG